MAIPGLYNKSTSRKDLSSPTPGGLILQKVLAMSLCVIDGHVSHSGDSGRLSTDQFLKVTKPQNRWYRLQPVPKPY